MLSTGLALAASMVVGQAGTSEEVPYKIISRGAASGPYQAQPDLCRLDNGEILAVFYGGYAHVSLPNDQWPRGGWLCMVRSRDEGRTWTEPAVLFDGPRDDRTPHISQTSDGTLWCTFFEYWKEGDKTECYVCLVRSTDRGTTWERTSRPVTPVGWACGGPVRELSDGTYVLGVYSSESYGGVIRSTDRGATWSEPIPIGKEAKLPLDAQTDVIERRDGSVWAALRGTGVNMHYSISQDKGLTWSPVRDIGFQAHAQHLTRLSTGEVLLAHRIPDAALHISRDDCGTWQGPYKIDTVEGVYPSTLELKDGSVLCLYWAGGEGSHVRARRFRVTHDGLEMLTLQ